MVMAMPCCHATDLDAHEHEEGVSASFCAAHSCECHSCDQTDCSEELDPQPELRTLTSTLMVTAEPVRLFTPPDLQRSVPRRPALEGSQLLRLKTIQLLI